MADAILTKHCARCKRVCAGSDFSPSKQRRDGLKAYCKRCCAAHENARRHGTAGDRIRASENARRAANLDRRLEAERRACAKRRESPDYLAAQRQQATARLEAAYKASNPAVQCVVCAVQFCNIFGRHSYRQTCSEGCGRELRRRSVWRKQAKRRALIRGATVERVDVFTVFERDGWLCHLCGGKTDRTRRGTYHPKAPELDHIVPLAKGGAHSYANTACAHRSCNSAKSDTIMGQPSLLAA